MRLLLMFSLATLGACTVNLPSDKAVRRHLIVGVGWVSVSVLADSSLIFFSSKNFGFALSSFPEFYTSLGYSQHLATVVGKDADLLLEYNQYTGKFNVLTYNCDNPIKE